MKINISKKHNIFKNSILLLFILFSNIAISQTHQEEEIDVLLQKAENSRRRFNHLEQLQYAKKASIVAEEIKNSQKIAESYYSMALALALMELPKESFVFVKKVSQEPYYQKSKLLQAKLKEVKAFDYYALGLTSQFDKEMPGIVKLLKGETSKDAIILLQRTYLNIGVGKPDSAKYYSKLCFNELKKIPEKDIHLELSDFYRYKGTEFLNKKPDSALYYYQKSLAIDQKYKDPILFLDYTALGDYYSVQKEYQSAIDFYQKAIQNIKEQKISPYHFVNNDLYKKIAEQYEKLGNTEKSNEYKKIYLDLQNNLQSKRSANVDHALKIILKDKEEEHKKTENNKYIWIIGGILLLIIIFIVVFNILRKNLKHKETLITEVHSTLQEKEEIISQKTVETEELQLKVNDAYNEVIELAKKNDPSFYFRFQEVYPDFQKELLEYSPGLRTSELILCAYTFLGFNVKEIADYTFKSVNTVRNRKQSLRKKFGLSGEQDMGIWLRNLIDDKT
ncbi:hypothetical protein ATE47_00670 [Chryseobacterium sp. IHB B 17019]|jgi:cell division protein FtsL/DNA-binding CsgD family transcriptional regulator|uniref:hypothetical protein n=1 Tax=Chryseobacterium sp. IHB B 17019 TaxID=1721091 RepID=UPI00071ED161|nr:hypothetical protein [Chryseobacterium sp. IHB B 17019]ALR29141.1 hypothetical protein ATE47_00670 [Chryseobacterium sp. IHB B 17019]